MAVISFIVIVSILIAESKVQIRRTTAKPNMTSRKESTISYVHVPKCGNSLIHTLVYTHCPALLGSCALNDSVPYISRARLDGGQKARLITRPDELLRSQKLMSSCTLTQVTPTGWHYPWRRANAPYGVIVMRDPFRRALSAFKFNGGHLEPAPVKLSVDRLRGWWRDHFGYVVEPAPPQNFAFADLKEWWKGNFTRYLSYPGVLACQTQMLLGYACNAVIERRRVNRSLAADILRRDFKYVGITDLNALSIRLYHRMFGSGWTATPCPQELRAKPVRATTKYMTDADRMPYLEEYKRVPDGADSDIYAVATRIFVQQLTQFGIN